MKLIPAINEQTFEEIKNKLEIITPFTDWVQIDVSNDTFSPHVTWGNPQDLLSYQTSLSIEVHLMIDNPENVLEQWLKIPSVKRAIIHYESTEDIDKNIEIAQQCGKELGLALNPETGWELLTKYFDRVNFVQLLAVNPGLSGQDFNLRILEKIRTLRDYKKNVIIEIDGGVNLNVAKLVKEAGADIINSSSFIFKNPDMARTIKALKEI
jgi:ribulose-phosphate 3-epimerase